MKPRSPTIRFLIRPAAVFVATGILLAILAPYRTDAIFPVWERLAFWIMSSCLCGCLLLPFYLLGRMAGRDYGLAAHLWLPLSATLAAVPATLIVQSAATAVNPAIQLLPFAKLLPSVLLLCLPLQFVLHLLLRETDALAPDAPTPDAPIDQAIAPLLAKLPKSLGDEILCMKTEDHYLRVFTPHGNALILMRMTDAEKTTGDVEGLRVHRSWWVARAAVRRSVAAGGNISLILSNGVEVPVSRERRHLLQAQGWLT